MTYYLICIHIIYEYIENSILLYIPFIVHSKSNQELKSKLKSVPNLNGNPNLNVNLHNKSSRPEKERQAAALAQRRVFLTTRASGEGPEGFSSGTQAQKQ